MMFLDVGFVYPFVEHIPCTSCEKLNKQMYRDMNVLYCMYMRAQAHGCMFVLS